jgi:hypothetical protein
MAVAIGYTLLLIALAIYLQGKYAPLIAAWKRERSAQPKSARAALSIVNVPGDRNAVELAGIHKRLRQLGLLGSAYGSPALSPALIGHGGSAEPSRQMSPRTSLLLERYAECGTVKVTLQAYRTEQGYDVTRRITVYRILPVPVPRQFGKMPTTPSSRERIGEQELPPIRIATALGLNLPDLMERTIGERFGSAVPIPSIPTGSGITPKPKVMESKPTAAPELKVVESKSTAALKPRSRHAYALDVPISGRVCSAEFNRGRKGFTVVLEKDGVIHPFTGKDLKEAFDAGKLVVGEVVTIIYRGKRPGLEIDGETITRNCFDIFCGYPNAA